MAASSVPLSVAAADASGSSTVLLDVSHSHLRAQFVQLRFDLHDRVGAVKEQLQKRTGTSVGSMDLLLYDSAGQLIAGTLDDSRPLGFYSVRSGFRLHVVDTDPSSIAARGWLDDTSLVPKYTMPEEKYAQLEDSARKFKQRLLEQRPDLAPDTGVGPDYMADIASTIQVGSRCEVDPGAKRGVVRFVGRVDGLYRGFWVGVEYDEPVGKHDGSLEGTRYFKCPPGHGAFMRPDKVKVGDYPERDPFADDEVDEL